MGDARHADSPGHLRYAFGPFTIDPRTRRLWRDGLPVQITAKTFDVLMLLLEQRDRVVSKDELLSRVWPDTVVQENNLARQISWLRRALGERPDEHDYIVTIPGSGYRFVADVRELATGPDRLEERSGIAAASPASSAGPGAAQERHPFQHGDGTESSPGLSGTLAWTAASRAFVLAAVLAILAATGAAVLLVPDAPRRTEPGRALVRITYDEAVLPRMASWSPDGAWLVYVSDRGGNADLWKQRPADPNPVRLTATEFNEADPAWSPDGRFIAFRSERDGGGLYVTDPNGTGEILVASFGHEPRWSPDSRHILFKRTTVIPDLPTLYVVGLDGMPPRPVRPDVLGRFRAVQAAWHPDGRSVSIWGTSLDGTLTFSTLPLDSGRATRARMAKEVQQGLATLAPCRFVWAPSRRYIYFEARTGDTQNIWRVTVDPESGDWTGGPERLTTGAGEETNLAISPDGAKLVFTTTSRRTRVWAFPIEPERARLTGAPTANR